MEVIIGEEYLRNLYFDGFISEGLNELYLEDAFPNMELELISFNNSLSTIYPMFKDYPSVFRGNPRQYVEFITNKSFREFIPKFLTKEKCLHIITNLKRYKDKLTETYIRNEEFISSFIYPLKHYNDLEFYANVRQKKHETHFKQYQYDMGLTRYLISIYDFISEELDKIEGELNGSY